MPVFVKASNRAKAHTRKAPKSERQRLSQITRIYEKMGKRMKNPSLSANKYGSYRYSRRRLRRAGEFLQYRVDRGYA